MFIGGILSILGIITLIIGLVTRAVKIVSLRDVAIAMEIAAVCVIYLIHNLDLSFINLFVPELSVIIGFLLFVFRMKEKLTKFTFYFKHKKGRKKLRPCTET